MARFLLLLCSISSAALCWAIAASVDSCDATGTSAACSGREVETQEQAENTAARLEMLQASRVHRHSSMPAHGADEPADGEGGGEAVDDAAPIEKSSLLARDDEPAGGEGGGEEGGGEAVDDATPIEKSSLLARDDEPAGGGEPAHLGHVDDSATAGGNAKSKQESEEAESLTTQDHNGNMCMLCGKPLPERVNKTYTEFRTDCGKMSSPTGPSADVLKSPVAKFIEIGASGVEANGFCQLNFAKSCADAVANKDYLYWAKSLNLKAPAARQNSDWDGRYCRLNGFLDASMVALQHDFHATQAKAQELCKTKYAKYNIENITFMDMMSAARYDDQNAPTHEEAELLAAWNCAMGDLGCDMSLCAYSFCEKASGTGLYDECQGWHPVNGMPMPESI